MLEFLQSLFRRKHPLTLAARSGSVAQFGQALLESKLVVIHAELGERLPLNSTDQEILKIVERAAANAPTDARFFSYEDDGKSVFPFFLSQSDAEVFCGAFSGRESALFAYQLFQVQGFEVARSSRAVDKLVMNAQCDDEFKVSSEWLARLQALPTSNDPNVKLKRLAVCIPHPSLGA